MVNNDNQDLDTLIGGGDCLHHYHNSDRFPTRDTLLWLQSLESVREVSANTSVTDIDDILLCTATSITITLPAARGGKHYTVVTTLAGNVTIAFNGTDTFVNGSVPHIISGANVVLRLKAVSGGWITI